MKVPRILFGALLAAGLNLPCAAFAADAAPAAVITLNETGGVPISPMLYGVNYDWDRVPGQKFAGFAGALQQIAHASLVRYPGGWNAEHFDWLNNLESGKRAPDEPGVAPGDFLNGVPAASFITPSEDAIADPAAIPQTVSSIAALVGQYGGRVNLWEIGNEWWLQAGAKQDSQKRAQNLQNYAALLAAVVPAIKAKDPSIKVFATADWTQPQDIARLRQLTGPAWGQIDGLSIHSYCGMNDAAHLCGNLPRQLQLVRQAAGKDLLYASEWAVVKVFTDNDYGIRNANYTVSALQDMAFAQIAYAAYWPPVKALPALAFFNGKFDKPFATGIAFGWMAQYYRGVALHTGGTMPAVAARDGGATTVIVPSGDAPGGIVRIDLAGTGLTKVTSAEVMVADQPDDPKASRQVQIVPLPTDMGTGADGALYVQFSINPGTPGRGQNFEIARVTLG